MSRYPVRQINSQAIETLCLAYILANKNLHFLTVRACSEGTSIHFVVVVVVGVWDILLKLDVICNKTGMYGFILNGLTD